MYNWEYDQESRHHGYLNLILFVVAAVSSLILFLTFHPQITQINEESPILINILFAPSMAIGFLYGMRLTERTLKPTGIRSPFKRRITKLFLFFFIIAGMFSSVSFALNGGSDIPSSSILDVGLVEWAIEFVYANGGATFLIISSITLMAAATKRIVGLDGFWNKLFTFVGTFIFFAMLAITFTNSDPTSSEVYLYTFYQAGIVGGALFQMNRMTKNLNMWEDYNNGF